MSEDANEQAELPEVSEQAEQPEANPRKPPKYQPDLDAIEVSQKHEPSWASQKVPTKRRHPYAKDPSPGGPGRF